MGIYFRFYYDHSPNMVMSRYPGCNFENFHFSSNFILKFRKSYRIWWKLAQEQKFTGKKQTLGWKTTPTSACGVNHTGSTSMPNPATILNKEVWQNCFTIPGFGELC